MKKFWEVKQSANKEEADIFIYGEIVSYKWDDTDTTAASFQKDLKELGEVNQINLHINSPGGSVFEGIAIGNMLKQNRAKVIAHVDALAASIASVIVASCDQVIMPENSMLMIHNPWTISMGNAKELRKQADDLDKIAESSIVTYLSKAGENLSEEKIKQIMDEETWLSANEAYEYGLCDVVESANKMVASVSEKLFSAYQNVPTSLKKPVQKEQVTKEQRDELIFNAKQNKAKIDEFLGGL